MTKDKWVCVAEGETGKRDRAIQKVTALVPGGAEFWLDNQSGKNLDLVFAVNGGKTDALPQICNKPTVLSTDCSGLTGDLVMNLNGKDITLFKNLEPSLFQRPEDLKVGIIVGKKRTYQDMPIISQTNEIIPDYELINEIEMGGYSGRDRYNSKDKNQYQRMDEDDEVINKNGFSSESGENIYILKAIAENMPPEGLHSVNDLNDDTFKWLANSFALNFPNTTGGLANEFSNLIKALLNEGRATKIAYLSEFIFGGKFYIKLSKTGEYLIVFKGAIGNNKYLTTSKYLIQNGKFAYISSIVNITKDLLNKNIKGALNKASIAALPRNNQVGFIVTTLIEVTDFFVNEDIEQNWGDLLGKLSVAFIKVWAATKIGMFLAGAALAATMGTTAPVWLVVGAGLGIALFVGWGLDKLDKRFGVTKMVRYGWRLIFKKFWVIDPNAKKADLSWSEDAVFRGI